MKKVTLFEDFILSDDDKKTIKFDPNIKTKNIDTALGMKKNGLKFQPRVKRLSISKVPVYTIYVKDSSFDDDYSTTDILKALKGQGDFKMDDESLNNLLKRSAIFFYNFLKDKSIDAIITVESSSNLTTRFQDMLAAKFSDKTILNLPKVIMKDLTDIRLDLGKRNLKENEKEFLGKLYDKIKRTGEFSIKKISTFYRMLFRDWLKVDQTVKNKLYDKTVVLIDDYVTSGTTLDEACLVLKELGVKDIIVIALIK